MAETLIPKGYTVQVCKNERQRATVGGEVSVTALKNPENGLFFFVLEDHVEETTRTLGPLNLRMTECLKDVILDLLWKAGIK